MSDLCEHCKPKEQVYCNKCGRLHSRYCCGVEMTLDHGDVSDFYTESWLECYVCGKTINL
jgi:hypothetical protein